MGYVGDSGTQKMAIQQIFGQLRLHKSGGKIEYLKDQDATKGEVNFPGGRLVVVADEMGTTWIVLQGSKEIARGQNPYRGSIENVTRPIKKWIDELGKKAETITRADAEDLIEEMLSEAKDPRTATIAALWKAIPTGNKGKVGGRRKIMFTGDFAKKMGKESYASAFMDDLSDDELKKAAEALGLRVEATQRAAELSEASQIDIGQIPKECKAIVEMVPLKPIEAWDGIHGVIVTFDGNSGQVGAPGRISKEVMKKIVSHPRFRWIEVGGDPSIGM